MSHTERRKIMAFSYIKLRDGKHFVTREYGPSLHGWMMMDGTEDPEPHTVAQVLLDFDEDGNVLGIEILEDGIMTYDNPCELVDLELPGEDVRDPDDPEARMPSTYSQIPSHWKEETE